MRRLAHTLAIWLLSVSLAAAQTGVGQIANGNLLANATGSQAVARETTPTSWFDQAYCNTIGNLIVRFTGAWTCSVASPANPVWWGADPTGVADSTSAYNSAAAASKFVQFPPGTFKFNSAITQSIAGGAGFHLAGAGINVTVLQFGNTNGFAFTLASIKSQVSISDVSITTTCASACTNTGVALNGAAVLSVDAVTTLTNVDIRGADGPLGSDTWFIGLGISEMGNINVIGGSITGQSAYHGNTFFAVTLTSTMTNISFHIAFTGTAIAGFQYGIFWQTFTQGLFFVNCHFAGLDYDVFAQNPTLGGALYMANNDLSAYIMGVAVNGTELDLITLNGNIFNAANPAGGFVSLNTYHNISIIGNSLLGNTGTAIVIGTATTLTSGPPAGVVADNMMTGFASGIVLASPAGAMIVHDNVCTTNVTTCINNLSTTGTNRVTDNIGYNPIGYTAGTSTGTTGTVISAGSSPETHYITQSANFNAVVAKCTALACGTSTNLCTVPSATVPCVIQLGPNENYKVTWVTTQPTYTKDIH